jgi:hypothetical protein
VAEHGHDAGAALRVHGKAGGQHDFGNAVAVHIPGRQIDHAGEILGDDVALPAGILEPYQFGHAGGERDEVGFAVVVHVDRHDLVAACQAGGDGVFGKAGGRRGGKGGAEEDAGERPHVACKVFLPSNANFG